MNERAYKIVEVVGTSRESWEQAAAHAVHVAERSLQDLRIAEVIRMDMHVEGDQLVYRTRLKLSFKYHE